MSALDTDPASAAGHGTEEELDHGINAIAEVITG